MIINKQKIQARVDELYKKYEEHETEWAKANFKVTEPLELKIILKGLQVEANALETILGAIE